MFGKNCADQLEPSQVWLKDTTLQTEDPRSLDLSNQTSGSRNEVWNSITTSRTTYSSLSSVEISRPSRNFESYQKEHAYEVQINLRDAVRPECCNTTLPNARCLAQGLDGTLRGQVKDSTGALVPGAVVTAKNNGTGAVRTVETSSAGTYAFTNLLVGNYNVSAELKGFKKYVRPSIGREGQSGRRS